MSGDDVGIKLLGGEFCQLIYSFMVCNGLEIIASRISNPLQALQKIIAPKMLR